MIQINKSEDVNEGFINFIVDEMKEIGITNIDFTQLVRWNNYLLGKGLFPKDIIIKGIENLKVYRFDKFFQIDIDKDVNYKGYKLRDICKLINNGNLEVKGYPFLSTIELHIKDNLQKYIIDYARSFSTI